MARQLGRSLFAHLTEQRQLRSSSTVPPTASALNPLLAGPPRLVKPDGTVIVPVPRPSVVKPSRQKRPKLVRLLNPRLDEIMSATFGDELAALVGFYEDEISLEEALCLSGMEAGRFPTKRVLLKVRPSTT